MKRYLLLIVGNGYLELVSKEKQDKIILESIVDGKITDLEGCYRLLKEKLNVFEKENKRIIVAFDTSQIISRELSFMQESASFTQQVLKHKLQQEVPIDLTNYCIQLSRREDTKESKTGIVWALPYGLLFPVIALGRKLGIKIKQFTLIEEIFKVVLKKEDLLTQERIGVLWIEKDKSTFMVIKNSQLAWVKKLGYSFFEAVSVVAYWERIVTFFSNQKDYGVLKELVIILGEDMEEEMFSIFKKRYEVSFVLVDLKQFIEADISLGFKPFKEKQEAVWSRKNKSLVAGLILEGCLAMTLGIGTTILLHQREEALKLLEAKLAVQPYTYLNQRIEQLERIEEATRDMEASIKKVEQEESVTEEYLESTLGNIMPEIGIETCYIGCDKLQIEGITTSVQIPSSLLINLKTIDPSLEGTIETEAIIDSFSKVPFVLTLENIGKEKEENE